MLYLEHLELIDRISASVCARNGVRGADAEDFASEVRLKLLQDDYAVLRKYRGESSASTFLTVVIANLFRDYRIRQWGKWRPSAAARRCGEAVVLLETAMHRDGCSFDEACRLLEQNGQLKVDHAELRNMMARLPSHPRRRMEDEASLTDVPSNERTDGQVLEDERRRQVDAAADALRNAVAGLDAEDRLMIRMHFFEGMSIADVARGLGLPQKPLYPRIRRLLRSLSEKLAGQGIGAEHLESLNSPPS